MNSLLKAALAASLSISAVAFCQDKNEAAVKLDQDHAKPFHPGNEISFRIKLNEPLPETGRVTIYAHQETVGQQISGDTAEALDKDRREFIIHMKIPDEAFSGKWVVNPVVVNVAKPAPTGKAVPIPGGEVSFFVDGDRVPRFPTEATVSITPDK